MKRGSNKLYSILFDLIQLQKRDSKKNKTKQILTPNCVCFAEVRKTSWKLLFLGFTGQKVRCILMWSCRGCPHPLSRLHPARPSTSASPPLRPQKAPANSPFCRRTPVPLHSACGHSSTFLSIHNFYNCHHGHGLRPLHANVSCRVTGVQKKQEKWWTQARAT